MILDNFDEIMFSIAQAKTTLAFLYFISLVIIGVMFFLNIFLAILLQNFGADNELMINRSDKDDDPL